jgi:N-acetylglucosaminyldiphosphoundecaprenol N-acetyl-beta-D-mannosaminyltransferase
MIDLGKWNLLGIMIDALDYEAAVARIIAAAQEQRPFAVSAVAVHGVMTGVQDQEHAHRLNQFDLLTPDGQPVRWALNSLYGTRLHDRVRGMNLTLRVCAAAAEKDLPVFFYGSTQSVVERLASTLSRQFPQLAIAGIAPSKFRRTTPQEKGEIARRIRGSGAAITFVGLGCPRQEVFAYEYREDLSMPVLAVGAAFDYLAGTLKEPPLLFQAAGLEWVYRLIQEPRRLWKRYTVLSGQFAFLAFLQKSGLHRPNPVNLERPVAEVLYG